LWKKNAGRLARPRNGYEKEEVYLKGESTKNQNVVTSLKRKRGVRNSRGQEGEVGRRRNADAEGDPSHHGFPLASWKNGREGGVGNVSVRGGEGR